MSSDLASFHIRDIKVLIRSIGRFSAQLVGVALRPYQLEAAQAITRSVFARDGRSFVILFARQSGKDEMLAIVIIYLLMRLFEISASMVCVQPTFKPQTINAMERLKARTSRPFFHNIRRTAGYIFRHQEASIAYFSADPSANVVGATADRLLIINEAQDVDKQLYDKRFAPMAAAGNATRVFSGTAWTSGTLLEREKQSALAAEQRDGIKRVFMVDGLEVAKSNPLYGEFLQSEIKKLGRQHPMIKTQYFNEEIDAQAGLFNTARRALMKGDQPSQDVPTPGVTYAFLIDVAGQDEAMLDLEGLGNPGRDSTTLSIVQVDLSSLETLQAPTFRIVHREAWTGQGHLTVFGQIKAFADVWSPEYVVVDATGVGEGLWAMLNKSFPGRVTPVKFSQQEKSEIGYGFIAILETGRFRDCSGERASGELRPCPSQGGRTQSDIVRAQYDACFSEILSGPSKTMRWGVKDGTRDQDGQLVHDDFVLADALVAVLDRLEWTLSSPTTILPAEDLWASQDRNY